MKQQQLMPFAVHGDFWHFSAQPYVWPVVPGTFYQHLLA
jgi:hypothetical protein